MLNALYQTVTIRINSFRDIESLLKTTHTSTSHHEEAYALQVKFLNDVKALTTILRNNGNPFLNDTNELATFGTRDVVEQAVAHSLITCYDTGK